MNTKEAQELLEKYVKSDTIKMHSLEVATIMRALAKEMKEDEDNWFVAGLLHDLDCDIEKDVSNQAKKAVEILKNETDLPEEIHQAILTHNEEFTAIKRRSKLDYALSAADNIAGFIYAYGLMRQSLVGMKVAKLKKRLENKSFAAKVNREKIKDIEKTSINLDKFFEIAISAMQSIALKIKL